VKAAEKKRDFYGCFKSEKEEKVELLV